MVAFCKPQLLFASRRPVLWVLLHPYRAHRLYPRLSTPSPHPRMHLLFTNETLLFNVWKHFLLDVKCLASSRRGVKPVQHVHNFGML